MYSWQFTPSPSSGESSPSIDLNRALASYQRKKESNADYYRRVTKPKREMEKAQLQQLPTLESLQFMICQLQNENNALRMALENAQIRNQELMLMNASVILPPLTR